MGGKSDEQNATTVQEPWRGLAPYLTGRGNNFPEGFGSSAPPLEPGQFPSGIQPGWVHGSDNQVRIGPDGQLFSIGNTGTLPFGQLPRSGGPFQVPGVTSQTGDPVFFNPSSYAPGGDPSNGEPIGVLPAASALFQNGPSLAPSRDPLTTLGQQSNIEFANNFGSFMSPYAQATGESLSAPNLENNPYAQQLMGANADQIMQSYREQILPSLRRGYRAGGGVGSSREGIAQGMAAEGALDAIGQSNAGILNNAYGQGLQQQRAAMTLMPQFLNSQLTPGSILQSIGTDQEQLNQAQRMEPYDRLTFYNSILSGNPGAGLATTNQSASVSGGSSLQGALGGAAGLGGLAAAAGAGAPWIAGAAGLGALLGLV